MALNVPGIVCRFYPWNNARPVMSEACVNCSRGEKVRDVIEVWCKSPIYINAENDIVVDFSKQRQLISEVEVISEAGIQFSPQSASFCIIINSIWMNECL